MMERSQDFLEGEIEMLVSAYWCRSVADLKNNNETTHETNYPYLYHMSPAMPSRR